MSNTKQINSIIKLYYNSESSGTELIESHKFVRGLIGTILQYGINENDIEEKVLEICNVENNNVEKTYIKSRTGIAWEHYQEGKGFESYETLRKIMKPKDLEELLNLLEINIPQQVIDEYNIKNTISKGNGKDDEEEEENGKKKKKSQLQIIDEILDSSGEYFTFFKDQFGQYYIWVNNKEIIELDTKDSDGRIYEYLRSVCRNSEEYPNFRPNVEPLNTIIKDFRVSCTESKIVHDLNVRIARDPDNEYTLHYDLVDEDFNIITINSDGWSINNNAPPIFKRHIGLNSKQIQPIQDDKNNVVFHSIFDKLIRSNDPDLKHLIKVYTIGAFIPDIQKPILTIVSDQDSGKTTLGAKIQDLVDPTTASKLKISDSRENSQTFGQMYYSFFDNLNKRITDSQSLDLCQAVTGGSDKKKTLYTNAGNYVFQFDKRAVSYTSTKLMGTQPDLLDRSLLITDLEPINAGSRIKESEIIKEYIESKPYMLGYIFDILVKVLNLKQQNKPLTCVNKNHRLLDFAEYCELISIAMGYEEGYFSKIYDKILSKRTIEALRNNTIGNAMLEFMDDLPFWTGDPTTLHLECKNLIMNFKVNLDEDNQENFYFPSDVRAFMKEIRKLIPLLKMQGIIITILPPRNSQRKVEIRNLNIEKEMRSQGFIEESEKMEQAVKELFESKT